MNISVIGGCGHVGLPLSLYLSHFGHKVVAFDISIENVKKVQSKIMPFIETGFQDILSEVVENGNFKATTDINEITESEVLIVVIGTEVDEHMNPQPNKIIEVMQNLLDLVKDGQLIILRSTVFPGVTKKVEDFFLQNSKNVDVAFCPERIAEGEAFHELITLPQIIGSRSKKVFERASEVFSCFGIKMVNATPEEAELAKLFTNSWRYIKFATANQFFMMATDFGLSFEKVRQITINDYPRAKDLPRAGFAAGPCLLKDTLQLGSFSNNNFALGYSAMQINEGLPNFVINKIEQFYDLSNLTIGILGMTFKANSDDKRYSLSYKIKKILEFKSKKVICSDPYILDPDFVELNDLIGQVDLLIVGVPHSLYDYLKIDKPIFNIWDDSKSTLRLYK